MTERSPPHTKRPTQACQDTYQRQAVAARTNIGPNGPFGHVAIEELTCVELPQRCAGEFVGVIRNAAGLLESRVEEALLGERAVKGATKLSAIMPNESAKACHFAVDKFAMKFGAVGPTHTTHAIRKAVHKPPGKSQAVAKLHVVIAVARILHKIRSVQGWKLLLLAGARGGGGEALEEARAVERPAASFAM